MWQFLRWAGIEEAHLAWFLDHHCTPDLLGINYYITSERFLDERLERYPAHTHGGNSRHRYADVEAVRVLADGPSGLATLLSEAWERYQLPMAITEAHLGCTVDEQQRWLLEVWQTAQEARQAGMSLRALTVWSLLGAYDWDSLVTLDQGHYEPGVFDVRGAVPRATPLARLVRDLARGRQPERDLFAQPGWWRRPDRLLYPLAQTGDESAGAGPPALSTDDRQEVPA
jgi:dTDP-4-dehydrorhamnose reductase